MVDQIKEKAHNIRELNNKEFDRKYKGFENKAKQEFDEIFRETKYNQRKKTRLSSWMRKKYLNRRDKI
jgi:hypothetical protein